MKKALSLSMLLLAASARAQAPEGWDRIEGQHSGIKTAFAGAVQDQQSWAEVWRRHDAETPAPQVDFTRESVVVVFLGRTRLAGTTVEVVVQQDPLDSGRLNVFYRETGGMPGYSAQVINEPFAIVKVPRAATINVERDGGARTPESSGAPRATPSVEGKVHALLDRLLAMGFDGR